VTVRSFKSSTSKRRSMDRKTADALKKEKATQKKVEDRGRPADKQHENN
jgi:hypothetical protein